MIHVSPLFETDSAYGRDIGWPLAVVKVSLRKREVVGPSLCC